MTPRGLRPHALGALLGIALAACEGQRAQDDAVADRDAAAAERPAGADTISDADTSAVTAVLKACDLVSEAELERILAVDLEPGTLVNDYAGVSQCRWYLPGDRQRGVSISLYERGDLENYRRVPGSIGAPGVGDAAVWNAGVGQLAVTRGERLVSVGLLIAEPQREDAELIARAALSRL